MHVNIRKVALTLTTLAAATTFAVACGEEEEVATNAGAAANPAALEHSIGWPWTEAAVAAYVPEYRSADALESGALQKAQSQHFGSADSLEHNAASVHVSRSRVIRS